MVRENVLLPHSAPSENLSSASSQLEDGPRSGIIIGITKVSPAPSPPPKIFLFGINFEDWGRYVRLFGKFG